MAEPPQIIRHTRALDELLWQILVWLKDPQAVIVPGEPKDKPVSQPKEG